MGWSGHHLTDPSEMEARFSAEDSISFMDSIFSGTTEESSLRIEQVREAMVHLPDLEADFVDLYYFKRWRQMDIARLFRVAQPTVHYRLKRATKRIKYLLEMPEYNRVVMEADLFEVLKPLNAHILLLMLDTTCQTEVASRLDISQGKVRHRFLSAIDTLAHMSGYRMYADVFVHVKTHLNMMREMRPFNGQEIAHHALM